MGFSSSGIGFNGPFLDSSLFTIKSNIALSVSLFLNFEGFTQNYCMSTEALELYNSLCYNHILLVFYSCLNQLEKKKDLYVKPYVLLSVQVSSSIILFSVSKKEKWESKSLGMEIYERHNRKKKREECKILILLNITCF